MLEQAVAVFDDEAHWSELTISELFSRQAGLCAEAPAIVFQEQVLTYKQLETQANQLAHFLKQHGVGPETVVALCLERGVDAIEHLVSLLAVWKAGGAYLMLDPAYYPENQARHILADGQVRLFLTQQRLQGRFPQESSVPILCLDVVQGAIRACPTTPPISSATLDTLAYLIYTSGSTGQPKGVLVEHRWLSWLAREQIDLFQVRPGDRLSHLLAPSFDASLSEILTTWLAGATLYPAPSEALRPGPRMVAFLAAHHISLAHFTPSVLAALPGDAPLPALRTLVIGGASCPTDVAMFHRKMGRRVIPVYGLTETVVCNFGYAYPGDGSQPSLGRPFSYVRAEIWDDEGRRVDHGQPGQIVLAGPLARGYTDTALTGARFIEHDGARWCLTGDYGAELPDGTFRFLGRKDGQLKVAGGLLTNLEDIAAVVRGHPEIADCAVLLWQGRYPVAYVTVHQAGVLRMSELRQFLLSRLPAHALPVCCIALEALPLTANGKVSSRIEDYPAPTRGDLQRYEELSQLPETEIERALAVMVQQHTENPLEIHDPQTVNVLLTLAELGVDSLGLVGVELDIAERFGVSDLTEEQLTTWPLYKLAHVLTERQRARSVEA